MFLRIEQIQPKKLIGQSIETSFKNDRTFELWRNFMPRRNEILNVICPYLYSMQLYPDTYDFSEISAEIKFKKSAAIAVTDCENVPDNMQCIDLPAGLYAVFLHVGSARNGEQTFRHIFRDWIPKSEYAIDHRLHFEILGEKYKHNQPDSEEEIWIPIRLK